MASRITIAVVLAISFMGCDGCGYTTSGGSTVEALRRCGVSYTNTTNDPADFSSIVPVQPQVVPMQPVDSSKMQVRAFITTPPSGAV